MKRLISAAFALSLIGSTAAVAQYNGQNRQNQTVPQQNNGPRDRHDANNYPYRDHPHWSRGDRLPDQYRQSGYVVNDWRGNHLRKPPRGHRWVRVNNQYILVAITTGLIMNAIVNSENGR